ncbi:ATP-binding protein [Devosia albogilva]|uniref:histidine kinase n=1 Tax=Devosia albogilva TaxID=429726 RepID=A0ABW5QMB4_9HYPH
MRGSIRRQHVLLTIVATVLVCAVALGAGWLAYLRQLGELERQVGDRLTLNLRAVESEIERFRYLPDVVGQDRRIADMLLEPQSRDAIAAANLYLEAVRDVSGADELYVLDLSGETLAASNWQEPGSFVGHNYAFRPYFTDAMARGNGRFYAVGVTTGKPGYFLTSRLDHGGRPLGVVVAKVDMSPLSVTWAAAGEMSAIADGEGVVFLSGDPRWLYRPMHNLDTDTVALLQAQRRYDGVDIAAAAPLTGGSADDREGLTVDVSGESYRLRLRGIEPDGWQLLSALPLEPVRREAMQIGGLAGLVSILAIGALLLARQRRQYVRLKLDQHATLERRVAERTEALAREVEERRRAEAELRATQENLIHAAKLAALGRMSAAIVHEVSQPLSALDNTLAAAGLHAERSATGEVQRNLSNARRLLRRMQRTVKHLRTFSSRREPGPPEVVDIGGVIEAALDIVAPQARDGGVVVEAAVPAGMPAVSGNAVRLEQVFINLLLNAIEATASAGNNGVRIAATADDSGLAVEIADQGRGIPEAVMERLFEPFFTTKQTGESLGLGLSISRTLLEEFGGALRFAPREGGGTIAIVSLPLHPMRTMAKQTESA